MLPPLVRPALSSSTHQSNPPTHTHLLITFILVDTARRRRVAPRTPSPRGSPDTITITTTPSPRHSLRHQQRCQPNPPSCRVTDGPGTMQRRRHHHYHQGAVRRTPTSVAAAGSCPAHTTFRPSPSYNTGNVACTTLGPRLESACLCQPQTHTCLEERVHFTTHSYGGLTHSTLASQQSSTRSGDATLPDARMQPNRHSPSRRGTKRWR